MASDTIHISYVLINDIIHVLPTLKSEIQTAQFFHESRQSILQHAAFFAGTVHAR